MIDFNLIFYFILDHPLNFTMCYSIFYSLDKTSENFWFTWSSMNQILQGYCLCLFFSYCKRNLLDKFTKMVSFHRDLNAVGHEELVDSPICSSNLLMGVMSFVLRNTFVSVLFTAKFLSF